MKMLCAQKLLLAFDLLMRCNIRFYSVRRIKAISCRPRRRKEEVSLGETYAADLKCKEGKKGQFVVSGIENVLRGVGLSQKQFVEQDPFTEEDVDEFDDTILHGEEFFERHNREKQAKKNFIEKKRIIKKYFREPPETNLLTVAAKEQIKYLHSLDPVQWDAEKLSESFPISVSGVKKLLRSNFLPETTEGRQKHDKRVANNIKLLKEGKEDISPTTQRLWQEGKLKLEYSVGNIKLPAPTKSETNKSLQPLTKQHHEKIGQFLSIVKPYLDLKEKDSLLSSTSKSVNENQQCYKNENLWEIRVSPSADQKREDISDDPLCASFLACKVDRSGTDVTFENIEQDVKHNKKTSKLSYNHTKKIAGDTTTEPFNPDSVIGEDIPQYENDTIELVIDSKRGSSHVVPYLYDSKIGYQHPLGEPPDYPDKIVIPNNLYKPGCKYKVGNCYYDDEGNFLYRVFA